MTDLTGKRILLTGGTSGVGQAMLSALVAAGAQVITCGRHQSSLDEALAAAPGDVTGVTAELARGGRGSMRCSKRSTTRSAGSTYWSPAPRSAPIRSSK